MYKLELLRDGHILLADKTNHWEVILHDKLILPFYAADGKHTLISGVGEFMPQWLQSHTH